MKTKFMLEVIVDCPDYIRSEVTKEAEHNINSFVRIKNQNGCEINNSKLTFSVVSGPIEIN
jgi:hypothetical protein